MTAYIPNWRQVYEAIMLILALISVSLIWIDLGWLNGIIYVVWSIFALDISVRLYLARKRWLYLLKHPFDIVSIIPLDSFFLVARFARFLTVMRLRSILTRYVQGLKERFDRLSFWKASGIFVLIVSGLNLVVMMVRGYSVAETLQWSFLSMWIFDYGRADPSWAVLVVTLLIKIVYILYVGYVVNRLFEWALSYQTELIRWWKRFRGKEDRVFYTELSKRSREHREAAGCSVKQQHRLMAWAVKEMSEERVRETAQRNASRGLRSVYFKFFMVLLDSEEVRSDAAGDHADGTGDPADFGDTSGSLGSVRLDGVRGPEIKLRIPRQPLILSPEDMMQSKPFITLQQRYPFLEFVVSVYNAPGFGTDQDGHDGSSCIDGSNASWFEIRGYWETHVHG